MSPPDQSKMKNDCSGCAFICSKSSCARANVLPAPGLPTNAVDMTSPASYKSRAGLTMNSGILQLWIQKSLANRFKRNLIISCQPPFFAVIPKVDFGGERLPNRNTFESLVIGKKE